jgi:hypothetical protein
MSTERDNRGNLHHAAGTTDGGKFAADKLKEQAVPLGLTGTRRRTADELGIHESILMAPCSQQDTYQNLHAALEPYRRAVSRLDALAGAQASGDQDAIARLSFGSRLDDALDISSDFFGETFKILTPEEIAPYWDRASRALEDNDTFELNRALLEASLAEEDAHPVRLDPNWRRPGVHLEDGFYESKRVVGEKQGTIVDHNVATINKHVRNDIDEAKKAGWLPANLDFRVRKPSSGSMAILVTSVPDDVKHVPHPYTEYADAGWTAHHPAVAENEKRLESIAQQYGSFESDTQQDFFNHSFHISINFQ